MLYFCTDWFFRDFSGIISDMDRQKLELRLNSKCESIWEILAKMHGRLVRFNPPKIVLDARLWRTAGMCHQDENLVRLGYKFFLHSQNYCDTMVKIILPHEIIHQADYNLFGESEKICGHGKNWCNLMVQYGLKPEKHHSMDIKR
jgi:predicted SprT family Zn-dependent metalloprotease